MPAKTVKLLIGLAVLCVLGAVGWWAIGAYTSSLHSAEEGLAQPDPNAPKSSAKHPRK